MREASSWRSPAVIEEVDEAGSSAVRAIRRITRESHAPVVAIGSVGRSVLSALVFGPGRHEPQPDDAPAVVVVPRPAPCATNGPVAVGFHGTRGSAMALRWAVEEAGRRGVRVAAVMAWSEHEFDSIAGCVPVNPELNALPGRRATRILEAALGQTRIPLDRVAPVVRRGVPVRVLLKESSQSPLLVVGAGDLLVHGYRVLGPTAGGCASRSSMPVAIVAQA